MYPFVLAGKIMAPFFSLKKQHKIFIFCPSADIGGSIQVNVDLCSCLADQNPLVIFSKKPKNNEYLSLFDIEGVTTIDLHSFVDYKWYHFINFFYRGIVSSWINQIENPVVVGGESLFFYKVLPHIKKTARRIDVCHLNTWFNYTQAFIKDLDKRIFSTEKLKRDAEALYVKNNLPEKYFSRLFFVDNKVELPKLVNKKNEILQVVFIGRGAPQKRVHLIAAIALKMNEMKVAVHFSFVGDVEKVIQTNNFPFCTFYGNVKDKNQMEKIYQNSDILLLTSAYEGLPIAIMEMMAHGKVVVSTAVDAIPDYITDGENGFLIKNYTDENKIVEEGIAVISLLLKNENLLKKVAEKSRSYAEKHFSNQAFCENYRKLLLG
jgi:glycosyltransferase involved in cell wall biosynthesis